jgi:hypothetical protein
MAIVLRTRARCPFCGRLLERCEEEVYCPDCLHWGLADLDAGAATGLDLLAEDPDADDANEGGAQ